MHPGIEAAALAELAPADLVAEGAAYAAALLTRIAADASNPADLVAVFTFMHGHPMLYGFAGVLFDALRVTAAGKPGACP